MKQALIVFVTAFFLTGMAYGADQPKQPTAAEQIKSIDLEDARAVVIIQYLQGQIDSLKEYRVRLKDARANLGKAGAKAEKGKAPVSESPKKPEATNAPSGPKAEDGKQ